MHETEIYSRLTTIFRDIFDEDSLSLTPVTSAADIDGWDSFNHINLIVAIEKSFGVRFATSELEGLINVDSIVTLIQKKQATHK